MALEIYIEGGRFHCDFTLVHNLKSVDTRIRNGMITPHIQILPYTTPLNLPAQHLNHNGTDPQYIGRVEPVTKNGISSAAAIRESELEIYMLLFT